MDNLPIKYQPRIGDRVTRNRPGVACINRGLVGTVIEASHRGVTVRYSAMRLGVYPLRHDLEVVTD